MILLFFLVSFPHRPSPFPLSPSHIFPLLCSSSSTTSLHLNNFLAFLSFTYISLLAFLLYIPHPPSTLASSSPLLPSFFTPALRLPLPCISLTARFYIPSPTFSYSLSLTPIRITPSSRPDKLDKFVKKNRGDVQRMGALRKGGVQKG